MLIPYKHILGLRAMPRRDSLALSWAMVLLSLPLLLPTAALSSGLASGVDARPASRADLRHNSTSNSSLLRRPAGMNSGFNLTQFRASLALQPRHPRNSSNSSSQDSRNISSNALKDRGAVVQNWCEDSQCYHSDSSYLLTLGECSVVTSPFTTKVTYEPYNDEYYVSLWLNEKCHGTAWWAKEFLQDTCDTGPNAYGWYLKIQDFGQDS